MFVAVTASRAPASATPEISADVMSPRATRSRPIGRRPIGPAFAGLQLNGQVVDARWRGNWTRDLAMASEHNADGTVGGHLLVVHVIALVRAAFQFGLEGNPASSMRSPAGKNTLDDRLRW
jgi:hypothetical protein